jgi:hypothetical protein
MSILDNNPNPQLTPAQICARNIKGSTKQTFQMIVNSFNFGTKNFWNNPRSTPSEIAQELGTDAKEIFELHYALGQFINSIKPGIINDSLSLIGQFTMNEDGTVTIIETVSPSQPSN